MTTADVAAVRLSDFDHRVQLSAPLRPAKHLILKQDRAFIGDVSKHNAPHFAEAQPDNPEHFCGFLAGLATFDPPIEFRGSTAEAAHRFAGRSGPIFRPPWGAMLSETLLAPPPGARRAARCG